MNESGERTGLFRCDGEYWTIAHGGRMVRVRHVRGLDYIAMLLQRPGEPIDAAELEGLGRSAAQDAERNRERERVRVTKAIRVATKRIAGYEPVLGELLDRTIRTGYHCSYQPGPHDPFQWKA